MISRCLHHNLKALTLWHMYGGLCGMQQGVQALSCYTVPWLHEKHCMHTAIALEQGVKQSMYNVLSGTTQGDTVLSLLPTHLVYGFNVPAGMHLSAGIYVITLCTLWGLLPWVLCFEAVWHPDC